MQAAAALTQRIFDQAFNRGELGIVDELVAENGKGMPSRRMRLKQLIAGLRRAFPDLHCTVEDDIGDEDKFAARWTMRGTHTGLFIGNQPTGKQIQVQGVIFTRIEEGMNVEYWILIDHYGLFQQLRIIPG